MPFVDPITIHNPATGSVAPAAWGDAVRDDLVALANPATTYAALVATQAIATATWTAISFTSEVWDLNATHSTSVNPSRFVCPIAGKYLVNAQAGFAAAAGGNVRLCQVFYNGIAAGAGTRICGMRVPPVLAALTDTIVSCSKLVQLAAGDYIELGVFHDQGGSVNAQAVDTFLQSTWLSF